jgi:site-specific DNA-methyltransferase (adenine-specific)
MKVTDNITITNEDNMELMKRYPDNYFDVAIVDPPYGLGFDGYTTNTKGNSKWKNKKAKIYSKKSWDSETPTNEYFKELKRVSKNQIIWGANHFIDSIDGDKKTPCWILWDKKNDGKNQADCEMAWTSFNTAVRMFRFLWDGMRQENIKNKEVRIHPTQKPRQLYNWILDNYAKEGDKILDTHLGSGSIALACHERGFELTACELDKEYYLAAWKRIEQHATQQRLF